MKYRQYLERLCKIYDNGEAKAILRLVLENRCVLSWTDVLCGALDSMREDDISMLEVVINRIATGEPVQYVLGEAEFCGRSFFVAPGVLIPRPETELIIEHINNDVMAERSCVLDVGTGSGCIAISLALDNPAWKVEAWDVSDDALSIARKNADRLDAENIEFRKEDILDTEGLPKGRRYDCIISNPPYICESERVDMERNVLDYEPELALFVPDDDPLCFYRAITQFAVETLMGDGLLVFEINRAYGKEVRQLMEDNNFVDVVVVADQFGNDRIVKGRKRS